MFKSIIKRISNFFRGASHVVGSLIGVKWVGEWRAEGLYIAGWSFLLGIPIGMLFLGPETFSVGIWLATVLVILMITNMDDTLNMMSNYLTYGIDGEQEAPYERT